MTVGDDVHNCSQCACKTAFFCHEHPTNALISKETHGLRSSRARICFGTGGHAHRISSCCGLCLGRHTLAHNWAHEPVCLLANAYTHPQGGTCGGVAPPGPAHPQKDTGIQSHRCAVACAQEDEHPIRDTRHCLMHQASKSGGRGDKRGEKSGPRSATSSMQQNRSTVQGQHSRKLSRRHSCYSCLLATLKVCCKSPAAKHLLPWQHWGTPCSRICIRILKAAQGINMQQVGIIRQQRDEHICCVARIKGVQVAGLSSFFKADGPRGPYLTCATLNCYNLTPVTGAKMDISDWLCRSRCGQSLAENPGKPQNFNPKIPGSAF
eukprot:1158269-Pelagomonas_calceolata.AAC.9